MKIMLDPVAQGLIDELAKEEISLIEIHSEYARVRVKYNVASRKYAAVRDLVAGHLGHSPYIESVQWPPKSLIEISNRGKTLGQFRFIHMKAGDAVVAALKEVEEPRTLDEIMVILSNGGFGLTITRMVNAALMRTSGIEKTDDGKYLYKKTEPDDIPF